MDLRKDADRVTVCGEDDGLRDMIAFFISIFGRSAFRAVEDGAKGFTFMAVGLYNITVVDQDNREGREAFFD